MFLWLYGWKMDENGTTKSISSCLSHWTIQYGKQFRDWHWNVKIQPLVLRYQSALNREAIWLLREFPPGWGPNFPHFSYQKVVSWFVNKITVGFMVCIYIYTVHIYHNISIILDGLYKTTYNWWAPPWIEHEMTWHAGERLMAHSVWIHIYIIVNSYETRDVHWPTSNAVFWGQNCRVRSSSGADNSCCTCQRRHRVQKLRSDRILTKCKEKKRDRAKGFPMVFPCFRLLWSFWGWHFLVAHLLAGGDHTNYLQCHPFQTPTAGCSEHFSKTHPNGWHSHIVSKCNTPADHVPTSGVRMSCWNMWADIDELGESWWHVLFPWRKLRHKRKACSLLLGGQRSATATQRAKCLHYGSPENHFARETCVKRVKSLVIISSHHKSASDLLRSSWLDGKDDCARWSDTCWFRWFSWWFSVTMVQPGHCSLCCTWTCRRCCSPWLVLPQTPNLPDASWNLSRACNFFSCARIWDSCCWSWSCHNCCCTCHASCSKGSCAFTDSVSTSHSNRNLE